MGAIIYNLQVKLPSRKAKKLYGYGWTWHQRCKFRTRPPDSAKDLHRLFLPYLKDDIPCIIRLIRNSAVHEHKGFKACMYGHMTHRSLEIIRRGRAWHEARSTSYHRVIPVVGDHPLPLSRQPEWSRPAEEDRLRMPRSRFRHGPFSSRILDKRQS